MITAPAAFAFLLLSFQTCRLVNGEDPTATIMEGGSAERQTRTNLRLPQKEKDADDSSIGTRSMQEVDVQEDDVLGDDVLSDDVETAWPTYSPISSEDEPFHPEYIAIGTSFESGYMRDPTAGGETFTISEETPWPTYFPTVFETRAPTIAIPTFGISLASNNCDPVGSRTNYIENPSPPTTPSAPQIASKTPTPSKPNSNEGNPTPNNSPVPRPTPRPATNENVDSSVTFRRGDMLKKVERLGIKVSKGMTVRVLARANNKVNYANGKMSELKFHQSPDGAAVIPLDDGGYVYVSNSEASNGKGGVYGLYFDSDGNVVEYQALLKGTSNNCGGGTTPWRTFISCEEYEKGQCWQVDPDPASNHSSPKQTKLGGAGGFYEAVACDNRDSSQPIFFVTEDHIAGALRKYTPPTTAGKPAGWDSLHLDGGKTEYLVFLDGNKFKWSSDESLGRTSQAENYPNVEGINYHDGMLYFVSKKTLKLYILDLDKMTYFSSSTDDYVMYSGVFKNSPDQLVRKGKFLYFTEDGGKTPGVYAIDADGNSYSIFEAYDEKYFQDETTGLSFSPDGTIMYACMQDCGCSMPGEIDCGCLLSFWRDDGLSFDGATMRLKVHAQK